jgi:type IV pilus assembly protein PilO
MMMALNPKDPGFQKAMLGGLFLAAFVYAFVFTEWLPITYKANASELNSLEEKYRDISKNLNKARQATHRLPYLEKEYLLLHRKWEQSQALLPESQDQAWCLRTISLLGAQTGVEFTLFRPGTALPQQYYTEYPIEIGVTGGYHQVGAFLGEVANLDRIINVGDLEITTAKDRNPDRPAAASFVARTYTLGGTGKPPEDEKAAKGKAASDGKGDKAKSTKKAAKPGKGESGGHSSAGGE